MKRLSMIIVLLCLFEVICAQTTKVYGDLGVENVNISIVNTQYGTSTDAKGHYNLPLYDRSETVNLYYSCIGYQDTLVILISDCTTPRLAPSVWDKRPAKTSIRACSRCITAMPTACYTTIIGTKG